MTRLVATDVDGTLLDHHNHLPPARERAVRRLTASGVQVVLATGKIWPSIRPLWEQLELPGPHVSCNGAAVVDATGALHACTPLPEAVAREVSDRLSALRVPHAIYLDDGTLVTPRLDPALDVLPALGEPIPTVGAPDGRGVLKVLSVVDEAGEADLRSLAADAARVQRTSHRFLEWNHPDADKAAGLRVVCERLGIALEDVVAIGDAENDVPMLRAAGTGVAVVGATPVATAAADVLLSDDLAVHLERLADLAGVQT